MIWYVSKHKDAAFNLIPKLHRWAKFISIRWWKRELVMYFGAEEYEKDDIQFTSTPIDPENSYLMSLRDFIECARMGLTAAEDGIGYYCDVKFTSNVAVDFKNLKGQAEMFLKRKHNGDWYPTHVLWFNK